MHYLTNVQGIENHPTTRQGTDPHFSSVRGEDSWEQLRASFPSTLPSGPGLLALDTVRFVVKDQMRSLNHATFEGDQDKARRCLRKAENEFQRKGLFRCLERYQNCIGRFGSLEEGEESAPI